MKILVVYPAEFGYTEMVSRATMIPTYRIASMYKKQGHEVAVFNIRPDLPGYRCRGDNYKTFEECNKGRESIWNCKNIWELVDGELYYKGEKILTPMGERKCGNWEKEHFTRQLVRIGRPLSSYVKKLLEFQPDVVVISQAFTYLWEGVKETIDATRENFSSAEIWIGGLYPTLCTEHAQKLGADKVVTKSKGCEDDFTRIDLSLYEEHPCLVGILTALGCPNSCGYCAVPVVEGHEHIRRDPMDVLDELEYYYANGIKEIEFLDSNFLVNYEKHFKVILEGIVKRNLKFYLKAYGGLDPQPLTTEILELMHEAGFRSIGVPIESSSEKLLTRWHRRLDAEFWKTKIGSLKKSLVLNSFVMIGCLGQTYEEACETIQIVEDAGALPVVLMFTPVPKTQEFEYAREFLGKDWTLEELHPVLYPLASEEFRVEELHEIVQKYCSHLVDRHGVIKYRDLIQAVMV
jgi:radical SAM superfamily enzyme YgiQ (UPF0313 family)